MINDEAQPRRWPWTAGRATRPTSRSVGPNLGSDRERTPSPSSRRRRPPQSSRVNGSAQSRIRSRSRSRPDGATHPARRPSGGSPNPASRETRDDFRADPSPPRGRCARLASCEGLEPATGVDPAHPGCKGHRRGRAGAAERTLEDHHIERRRLAQRAHLAYGSAEGSPWRLSHERLEFLPATTSHAPFRCHICTQISWWSVAGRCPQYRCLGELVPISGDASDPSYDHYRRLYASIEPLAMAVEEHTAQWTSAEASRIQDEFSRGLINVLSCSTTFELGVDVGEVEAVLSSQRTASPGELCSARRACRPSNRRRSPCGYVRPAAEPRPYVLHGPAAADRGQDRAAVDHDREPGDRPQARAFGGLRGFRARTRGRTTTWTRSSRKPTAYPQSGPLSTGCARCPQSWAEPSRASCPERFRTRSD